MLVNRVSDTFLFISVMLMWWYLGTTDYTIFLFNTKEAYYLDWICLTMMLGAAGKSAQIGLHTWLADAMEGQTHTALRRDNHVNTFLIKNGQFRNVTNRKLINTFSLTFTRQLSRTTYSISKLQWKDLLPVVIGCLLSGHPIRPPSSYIASYITFRHTNKQILEIVAKQVNLVLRGNSQIALRRNFYYLHSKPLSEITSLFNLLYEKDTCNITRRKDGWVRNPALLFSDLFIKSFNIQSLVFWFLLCGAYNNLYKTVMFNVGFYKKAELLHLSKLIENKCNIKTIIREHTTRTKTLTYYLYISDDSLKDFIDLINSYYDSTLILKKPSVIYTHGSKEFSILIGLMLGDGSITLSKGVTGTARYEHTCKHREFLIALSNQWLPVYYNKGEPTPWPEKNPTQWWRGSKMLPELFDLYMLWYKPESINGKKVKIIPLNLLENYFNELSLAHWFMDDGYFNTTEKTFFLCTDNFTYIECTFLAVLIYKKLKIKTTVNKRTIRVNSIPTVRWRIRVSRYSVPLFRQLVKPYILSVFHYKLAK
jgi:hypothetical protein